MSAVLPRSPSTSAWSSAGPMTALVLVFALGLYGETFAAMARTWSVSDTYAHAFLVLPISLWMVWRQRARLRAIEPRPAPWVLLPLALAACGWWLADLAGVNAAAQFAATTLLVLAIPALLGVEYARAIAFPLAFLFFMVPFGEFTTPTMMEWTADVTVAAVRAIGIPVYREGMQFVIPSGTWSVVEACSGTRYLIASFMVGTLFAYLSYASTKKRLLFALVSLLVPIVANWLRAIMIVLLGHYSDNRIAVGVDHLIHGWIFFGVVIALMFWIGARWSDHDRDAPVSAAVASIGSGRPAASGAAGGHALVALMTLVVLAMPHAAAWRIDAGAGAVPTLRLPDALGAAVAMDDEPDRFPQPVFVNPSVQASRHYADAAGAVMIHVAYYRRQSYDHKLANAQNVVVRSDDPTWAVSRQGTRTVSVNGRELPMRSLELRGGALASGQPGRRVHVLQVYWVDGQLLTGNTHALLVGLRGRLVGRGDDAAAVTFMFAGDEPGTAQRALDRFVADHLDAILSQLAAARAAASPPNPS